MSIEKDFCRMIEADPRGDNWTEELRKHSSSCPTCAAFLEGSALLGDRLKALPSAREEMPAELRQKMMAQLSGASTAEPVQKSGTVHSFPLARRILVPVSLAASLVLGVLLEKTFEFGAPRFPVEVEKTIGLYIEDVTHDHFLLERIGRPLEVEIKRARDLSDWLSASLNFDFQLPETRGPFALQGGRVWHTVGRLSALASYTTDSGHRVVLFAVPAENLELAGAESSMIGTTRVFTGQGWGHEARVWIEGDLALALTAPEGELPPSWEDVFLP